MTCKRGFACLSLICALQILPQTVLADESASQIDPKEPVSQIQFTDSVSHVDPAEAAAQNNAADSAEASEDIAAEQKEEAPESAPADDAASFEGESAQDNVPEALGSENTQDSVPEAQGEADAESAAAPDDAAYREGEDMQDSVPEAAGNDVNAGSPEVPGNDVNANAASPDDAVSGDDRMTDDADPEETKASPLVQQPEGDSPTAAVEYPSRFDLRDLGRVTPVKLQQPWGTCWAFAATAAAESSILTKMDSTYAETGLDLSERYLAWYVAQPVTENISTSQAGEGLHLYDENPNNIYLYGGKEKTAGTLYAQGIGPVPESEYPYRGREGKLAYETMLSDKDAYIETAMASYRQIYKFEDEETLRSWAEEDYENDLARYALYDTYSQFDDWTISEADEPGSGRLRGSDYTLIDNNVLVYWVRENDDGVDEFGKEPFAVLPWGIEGNKLLYQDSIDQIKSEIYAGRGVSVDIQMNIQSLNEETWSHYYDASMNAGLHGVCIVGWDDDYDASNFATTPPGNGAWIVKNSWGSQTDLVPGGLVAPDGTTKDANGSNWGVVDENGLHTGYFYLSYYDQGIGTPVSFDFDLRENHDQENALQLDYMPAATAEWVKKNETPIWCANVFTLEKDMRIDEVATRFTMDDEVPLTGFTVTFDIYRLSDGAAAPDDGELLASCTREFKNFGYHRVALDAPVYSKTGDRLAVIVRQRHNYGDGTAKYVATAQVSLDYYSNPLFRHDPLYGTPVVNEGESFLKVEGVTEKDEAATEGWLDLCAPFSKDFLWYVNPALAKNPAMAEYYESVVVGNPICTVLGLDNFGIKAFGEPVTLEYVEAVAATCEDAGSLAYWRDPLSGAIFEDGSGVKPLTLEDVMVNALGHIWGEPTYTWAADNSGVTAKSICRREKDHVLWESVDTTSAFDANAGKITWTAQFGNEIFTTQTRSADAEPVCDDTGIVNGQSAPVVRTCTVKKTSTVKKASSSPAGKTSDTTVTHPDPVPTGDDAEPALWYTLLAEAAACIAAAFALHRRKRRLAGTLTDSVSSDDMD